MCYTKIVSSFSEDKAILISNSSSFETGGLISKTDDIIQSFGLDDSSDNNTATLEDRLVEKISTNEADAFDDASELDAFLAEVDAACNGAKSLIDSEASSTKVDAFLAEVDAECDNVTRLLGNSEVGSTEIDNFLAEVDAECDEAKCLIREPGNRVGEFSQIDYDLDDALMNDDQERVDQLLNQGAKTVCSPLIALLQCDKNALAQNPPNETDEEIARRKVLAHMARFDTEEDKVSMMRGEKLDLMGSKRPIMYDVMTRSLHEFKQIHSSLDETKQDILFTAMRNVKDTTRTPSKIVKELNEKRMCILPLGYEGHAISLVLYKDHDENLYFGVCDADIKNTIDLYVSDFKGADDKLVEFLKNVFGNSRDVEYSEFNFEKAIASLGGYKCISPDGAIRVGDNLVDPKIFHIESIRPKSQKSGTCSFSSAKCALRLAWALLALEDQPVEQYEEIASQVKNDVKEFSAFLLEGYIKKYTEESTIQDAGLIGHAREKLAKKKARIFHYKSQNIFSRTSGQTEISYTPPWLNHRIFKPIRFLRQKLWRRKKHYTQGN